MKRKRTSGKVIEAGCNGEIHLFRSLISLLLLFLAINLQAQTRQLSGVVRDSGGETVAGAAVRVLNTIKGVVTDVDGRFVLTLSPGENVIQVSFVGMKTLDVNVQGMSVVEVTLQYDMLGMDEIVVVGYGVQKKGDVTSSISSVKADAFVKGAVKDAAQLIQGKVAGLTISNPSGDPTSNAQIMLRGITTLSASTEPLILIDGVPGSLSTVAPEDIESIDVLKDGSAAAIYGTRGTNGVIIITTKGVGHDIKPTVEYNAYATVQTIARKMPFLTAAQYRQHMPDVPGFVDLGSTTDWLGEITRTPVSMNHNITLKGGNDQSNYTASVNYRYWEGLFIRSDNQQVSGRIGINHTALDGMLKMSFNSIIRDRKYWTGGDGYSFNNYVYRQAIIRNPTDAIYDSNGNWQERDIYFYDNPVAYIMESDGENNDREIQMNGRVTLTPVERWNINLLLSNNTYNQTRGFAQTKKHVSTTKSGRNGYASRGTTANQSQLLELTTDYAHTFGKSNISLMGGYSYQTNVYEGFWMTNWDFPTDYYSYNRMESGDALTRGEATMSSNKSENTLIAFFARASYNFDDKYLLMASLRREGSSKFGANHKWGTFPAISLGWRLSREPFLQDIDFITDLKLRAGYGITGTAPGSSYMSLISLNYGERFLSNGVWVQGLAPNRNPNPDLRWERKGEVNIGLDFGFAEGRINGSVDFYHRRTNDMLWNYQVPTPPYLYSSITSNVGVMDNRGFEALIQGTLVARSDFNWLTGITYSTNRNKLVSLSNDQFETTNDFFYSGHTGEPIQQSTHIVKIGDQIGNFYGWKSVDITDGGIWIVESASGEHIPITESDQDDRQVLGNGLPKHYLGWNNSVRFRNFDLEINMRGAFGFQILNFQRLYYENPRIFQYNMLESAFDKVYGKARLTYDLAYVSYYIEDGDYWKIDNLTLGYTFKLRNQQYVKSARIYASGLNLYTLTGYKGIDPEVNRIGLNPGNDERDKYPTTRTFTLGVNLTF